MRWVWLLVLAAACRGILGIEDPIVDPGAHDAPAAGSDGANPPGCPAPPPGCTPFACAGAPSCYYDCGHDGTRTWMDAALFCGTNSIGCLATITNDAENTCIATATRPTGSSDAVWIGYAQDPQGVEPSGGWTFVCGGSTLVNWAFTEPNNLNGDEDCATLHDSGGKWFDDLCASRFRFTCKLARP